MNRAPERITIKRRRDEEPVDRLFIQQKKHQSNIVWKRVLAENADHRYAAASSGKEVSNIQKHDVAQNENVAAAAKSGLSPRRHAEAPSIHDAPSGHARIDTRQSVARASSVDSQSNKPPSLQGNGLQSHTHRTPRKFRLARRPSFGSGLGRTSSQGAIRKSSPALAPRTCVFVEMTRKQKNPSALSKVLSSASIQYPRPQTPSNINIDIDTPPSEPSTPRRRPIRSCAEIQRQAATRNLTPRTLSRDTLTDSPRKNASLRNSGYSNFGSQELSSDFIKSLQEFALQESNECWGEDAPPTQDAARAPSEATQIPTHLKFQPKASRPRASKTAGREETDALLSSVESLSPAFVEDAAEFVYDTYIKASTTYDDMASSDSVQIPKEAAEINAQNYGLLVVDDEEEEEFWSFGHDTGSDSDTGSEEDDENAEDYYGNDYPEDETNSSAADSFDDSDDYG